MSDQFSDITSQDEEVAPEAPIDRSQIVAREIDDSEFINRINELREANNRTQTENRIEEWRMMNYRLSQQNIIIDEGRLNTQDPVDVDNLMSQLAGLIEEQVVQPEGEADDEAMVDDAKSAASSELAFGFREAGKLLSRSPTPALLASQKNKKQRIDSRMGTQSGMSVGGAPKANPKASHVIWGTQVSIQKLEADATHFFKTFTVEVGGVDHKPYMELIASIIERWSPNAHENVVPVDMTQLMQEKLDLYKRLVLWPQEAIPALDVAVVKIASELQGLPKGNYTTLNISCRPYNLPASGKMRNLSPTEIDHMINVSGLVIRTSSMIPIMQAAYFMCSLCNHAMVVEVGDGRITEPDRCAVCKNRNCITLQHNMCTFTDSQYIKLQEHPDDVPRGHSPQSLVVIAHGSLVDSMSAGDRVTLTGIYRATGARPNPKHRSVQAVYKTHIDLIYVVKDKSDQLHYETEDDSNEEDAFLRALSTERIAQIKKLAGMHDCYERVADAIAPAIFENEDVKKALLLQLLSGTPKDFDMYNQRFRNNINVLLCGDPGTSKSQLLQYVYKLVPRSQYTSGRGSSAVGLTAYVTKDPETKQMVLQTGALCLADNGVCCIDEFDKMHDSTRSVLHEVMEQQTLSIAKAGIICQLNARTSVLAAANPVHSSWDQDKSIIENLNLPHTLLSRFDLIFLILDKQSEKYDRQLAEHLISMYRKGEDHKVEEKVEHQMLRDYIMYVRKQCKPRLSDAAKEFLATRYVEMRDAGKKRGVPSAYPRQLESLIRLSEAHAKVTMSEYVTKENVEEAYRLYREALKQSCMDPLTGRIDIGILTTGVSSEKRKQLDQMKLKMSHYLSNRKDKKNVPINRVMEEFVDHLANEHTQGVFKPPSREEMIRLLGMIHDDGDITIKSKAITIRY